MTPNMGAYTRAHDVVDDKGGMRVPPCGRSLRLPSWKEAEHGTH